MDELRDTWARSGSLRIRRNTNAVRGSASSGTRRPTTTVDRTRMRGMGGARNQGGLMRSRNTRLTGIMAAVAVGALVVGCSDAGSSDADGSTRTGSASASSAALRRPPRRVSRRLRRRGYRRSTTPRTTSPSNEPRLRRMTKRLGAQLIRVRFLLSMRTTPALSATARMPRRRR